MMMVMGQNAYMHSAQMRFMTSFWQPYLDATLGYFDRHPVTLTLGGLRQLLRAHPVFNQMAASMPNEIKIQYGVGKLQHKNPDLDTVKLVIHAARPFRNLEAAATVIKLQNHKFEKTEWDHLVHHADISNVQKGQHEDLLHFKPKSGESKGIKYIVAPRSGHFSTLVAPAIQTAIDNGYEVFVNDIHDAAYVIDDGKRYGMDQQVDDKIKHLKAIYDITGQRPDAMGICQGGVPLAIAVAKLCKDKAYFKPKTWGFFSGPGDISITESAVSKLGKEMPEFLMENLLVSNVSKHLPGDGTEVRAGMHQVDDFMKGSPARHMRDLAWIMNFVVAHGSEWVNHEPLTQEKIIALIQQDDLTGLERAFLHELQFRTEYNTSADQPSASFKDAFMLNFKGNFLAEGTATYHGEPISLMDIDIPTLTTDAEADNISSIGQSMGILAHMRNDIDKSSLIVPGKGHFWWAGKTAYEDQWPRIYKWQDNPTDDNIPDFNPEMINEAKKIHAENELKERQKLENAGPIRVSIEQDGYEVPLMPPMTVQEVPMKLAA
jgi:poly-beta-hydroxyalkanoate depolymerase